MQLARQTEIGEETVIHGSHACRRFGIGQGEGACPLRKVISKHQDILLTIGRGWQTRQYIHSYDIQWGACQYLLEPSLAAGRRTPRIPCTNE